MVASHHKFSGRKTNAAERKTTVLGSYRQILYEELSTDGMT
jgi:hypothetical protein